MGFSLSPSVSPIMPILVGNAETAITFAEHLFTEGVYAPAIRPPTVPDATSRIRVTVTSEHTPATSITPSPHFNAQGNRRD